MKIRKKKQLEMILERVPNHPNPKVELEQYSTPSSIASDLVWNAYSLGDIRDLAVLDLGCGTGIFSIASWLMGASYSLGIDIDPESIALGEKTIIDLNDINQQDHAYVPNINLLTCDINSYNSIDGLLNDIVYQSDSKYDKLLEFYNSFSSKSSLDDDGSNLNEDSLEIQDSNDVISVDVEDSNDAPHESHSLRFDTLFQNPPFGSQEFGTRHADRKFMEFAMASADVIYSFHMKSTEEFVIDFYRDLGGEITHKFIYDFPIPRIYDFHKRESRDVKVVVLRVENFNE